MRAKIVIMKVHYSCYCFYLGQFKRKNSYYKGLAFCQRAMEEGTVNFSKILGGDMLRESDNESDVEEYDDNENDREDGNSHADGDSECSDSDSDVPNENISMEFVNVSYDLIVNAGQELSVKFMQDRLP